MILEVGMGGVQTVAACFYGEALGLPIDDLEMRHQTVDELATHNVIWYVQYMVCRFLSVHVIFY